MSILKVPYHKRLLSYLYPVRLWKGSSENNPTLEVLLYHNKHQLATADALYSDSDRYRPLRMAFDFIGTKELRKVKHILVLGAGLGSAVEISKKERLSTEFTLVDNDDVVLSLARQVLRNDAPVYFACADAVAYVKTDLTKYDVVIVDAFISRVVPDSITSRTFLADCHARINPGGYFVLNYIINNNDEWIKVQENINAILSNYDVLSEGINRIIIARV